MLELFYMTKDLLFRADTDHEIPQKVMDQLREDQRFPITSQIVLDDDTVEVTVGLAGMMTVTLKVNAGMFSELSTMKCEGMLPNGHLWGEE